MLRGYLYFNFYCFLRISGSHTGGYEEFCNFWDIMRCALNVSRRFGDSCRTTLSRSLNSFLPPAFELVSFLLYYSSLKMEAKFISETPIGSSERYVTEERSLQYHFLLPRSDFSFVLKMDVKCYSETLVLNYTSHSRAQFYTIPISVPRCDFFLP
jgi:hypothetical protein